MIMGAQAVVTPFLATFKDFPPRQKAASFTLIRRWRQWPLASAGGKAAKSA
jgi:hypothetical protein